MQIKSTTYEEFVAKFQKERARTTDDCYTPKEHHDKIRTYVHNTYNIPYEKMVRPFYPEADYTSFEYDDVVVVDNPPFSIYSEIVRWYANRNIPFFLYAPGLTPIVRGVDNATILIPNHHSVIYDNGAQVRTAYITNMDDPSVVIRTMYLPDIKPVPYKQSFPPQVISGALFNKYASHATTDGEVILYRHESLFTRKACGKQIYGAGYFVSDEFINRYHIKGQETDMQLTKEDEEKLLTINS